MMKNRILRRTALLLGLLLGAFTLRADVTVFGRVRLRRECSAGKDLEYLRTVCRKLDAMLRSGGERRLAGDKVVILPNSPEFRFRRTDEVWLLNLPSASPRWTRDFALRRQLYGALLAAKFQLPAPESGPGVAPWCAAAIDCAVERASGAERFLADNRDQATLGKFFRYCHHLPDFAALCRLDPEKLDAVSFRICREQARLLLEILIRKKLFAAQLASDLSGGAPDAWTASFPADPEKRRALLEEEAWPLVWGNSMPLPPENLLLQLPELSCIRLPEVDPEGNPTGKLILCTPPEAALQLAIPRSDADAIRRAFAAPWRTLGRECDPMSRSCCRKIVSAILRLGTDPDAPEDFAATLEQLQHFTELRIKYDLLLDRAEREMLPLKRSYTPLMGPADFPNPALTTPERIFLRLTEAEYLAE